MIKKIFAIFAVVIALTAALVSPALAISPMVHYDLYPHRYVPSDSWGKITYNREGETMDFVLTVHNLEPNTRYTLNTFGVVGIGTGVSNPGGNLTIVGSWDCTHSLTDARINLRKVNGYEWTLWTGLEHIDTIFTCTI